MASETPTPQKSIQSANPLIPASQSPISNAQFPNLMRILIVEDDQKLGEVLEEALRDNLYIVDLVTSGEAACMQVKMIFYDLIILDLGLPKLDGISVCQILRNNGYKTPILMLTARDTINDKVNGLDAGADDYVLKPVDLPELLARIRAIMRRGDSLLSTILEWENLKLNPITHEVIYDNKPFDLSPKEFCLLELFMRNAGKLVTRNMILESLWSFEDPPKEETIKTHIKNLRKKLKKVGVSKDFIKTVHKLGYKLIDLN